MELYSSEHVRLDAEIAVEFGKSGGSRTGHLDQEGEEASSGRQKQPATKGQSCAKQSSQGVQDQEE